MREEKGMEEEKIMRKKISRKHREELGKQEQERKNKWERKLLIIIGKRITKLKQERKMINL